MSSTVFKDYVMAVSSIESQNIPNRATRPLGSFIDTYPTAQINVCRAIRFHNPPAARTKCTKFNHAVRLLHRSSHVIISKSFVRQDRPLSTPPPFKTKPICQIFSLCLPLKLAVAIIDMDDCPAWPCLTLTLCTSSVDEKW